MKSLLERNVDFFWRNNCRRYRKKCKSCISFLCLQNCVL